MTRTLLHDRLVPRPWMRLALSRAHTALGGGSCWLLQLALLIAALLPVLPGTLAAAEGDGLRSVDQWLDTALCETRQQQAWDAAHPQDRELFRGAGQFMEYLYGTNPGPAFVAGPTAFITWWQDTGVEGMELWAEQGFPMCLDRDHLIYNALALDCAQGSPRSQAVIYINGDAFQHPERFWAYYDRIKKAGIDIMVRGYTQGRLSLLDYQTLRLFAPLVYSLWGSGYLPFDLQLTPGNYNDFPTLGMQAPDFTLPPLEWSLKSPLYTDAYAFDACRAFHSQVAAFLLYAFTGYEAIPKPQQGPDGAVIRAKPYRTDIPGSRTLSASRGKKPVLLVFTDPIDGDNAGRIPMLEPLYQATKDQVDWYLVCDDITDNIYWSCYYFPPNLGAQTFQKAVSFEERGQLAKMLLMRYANLSFPVLLDDLQQRAQNAYSDGGGLAKVVLIDKQGVVTLNNKWHVVSDYIEHGPFRYNVMNQCHAAICANVSALLAHAGIWTGKPAVIPDWQPPESLEHVAITALDPKSGTITVPGPDGKALALTVDPGTRIIFAGAGDTAHTLSDLAVGMQLSLTYEADLTAAGHVARFILRDAALNDFLTSPLGVERLWCPLIATTVTGFEITASLAPRPAASLMGMQFWHQPNASGPSWMVPVVQGWLDRPDQVMHLHVDRATEIYLNGMRAKLSDIMPGDHLGVEIRPEQSLQRLSPFFIFIYRYGPAAESTHDSRQLP